VALISYSLNTPKSCTIAAEVMTAIEQILAPARSRRVEGIAYLLGRTDGTHACILSCVRVDSVSSAGSFHVRASEIGRVVDKASASGLQVVGQVHTHPFEAFHSEGDDVGAQIRFDGFVSIVLPNYGTYLPTLHEAAIFVYDASIKTFVELAADHVHVTRAQL